MGLVAVVVVTVATLVALRWTARRRRARLEHAERERFRRIVQASDARLAAEPVVDNYPPSVPTRRRVS